MSTSLAYWAHLLSLFFQTHVARGLKKISSERIFSPCTIQIKLALISTHLLHSFLHLHQQSRRPANCRLKGDLFLFNHSVVLQRRPQLSASWPFLCGTLMNTCQNLSFQEKKGPSQKPPVLAQTDAIHSLPLQATAVGRCWTVSVCCFTGVQQPQIPPMIFLLLSILYHSKSICLMGTRFGS